MQGGFLSSEEGVQLRKHIINMVLGTDMKKHFDIVSRFQVTLASAQRFTHQVVHAYMTNVLSQPLCLSALPNTC